MKNEKGHSFDLWMHIFLYIYLYILISMFNYTYLNKPV
jgi:hypothetical protein